MIQEHSGVCCLSAFCKVSEDYFRSQRKERIFSGRRLVWHSPKYRSSPARIWIRPRWLFPNAPHSLSSRTPGLAIPGVMRFPIQQPAAAPSHHMDRHAAPRVLLTGRSPCLQAILPMLTTPRTISWQTFNNREIMGCLVLYRVLVKLSQV